MNPTQIPRRPSWFGPLALFLAAAAPALGQLPFAELRTIFPPGAQAGESVEVTIGGSNLEETEKLIFSHPGIRCEQIEIPATEFTPKRHHPLRYRVAVSAEVPPGTYEAFADTRLGITAPLAFAVGTLPELVHDPSCSNPETPMPLPIGTVVNGQADSEGIDHYLLDLKQDQRVVIQCRGEPIDSRLDATLVLLDSDGRELMRDRDTIGRDALLAFAAPADGRYTLKVFDFIYRGGAEYPYRLVVSGAPHVDFVYPPAGQPGTTSKFKLYGHNLPGGSFGEGVRLDGRELESVEVDIDLRKPDREPLVIRPVPSSLTPGLEHRLASDHGHSNPVKIGFAAAPIVEAVESGDDQRVEIPCEIHGRFDRGNDLDRYRFEADEGIPLAIECLGERIRKGSDPFLTIERITRDEQGNEKATEIASDDDGGSNAGGRRFPLQTRDPMLRFTPPEKGTYRVSVLNQIGQGGPSSIYRLIVRPAAPDFELLATPLPNYQPDKQIHRAPALLRHGGTCLIQVFALRKDGFDSEIALSAEGLPPGVTCPLVTVKKNQDSATLYLQCSTEAPEWKGFISIKGTAGDLVHDARFGTNTWSVGNWDQERAKPRLSQRLALSVCPEEKAPIMVQSPEQTRYELPLDGKLELPVKLVKNCEIKGELIVQPDGLPYSKNPPQLKLKPDANDGKLTITFKKTNEFPIEPGEWQFTIRAEGTVKHQDNLAGVARAEAEQTRLAEMEKTLQEQATEARAAAESAKQSIVDAEKNLQSATPEAKPDLEKALDEKKAQLKLAEETAAAAEAKANAVATAKNAAAERLKKANEQAKVKEIKHAAYSVPITVVINPPAPKEDAK